MSLRLVLATANPGKLRELSALLRDSGFILRSLNDFPGLRLPPEGGSSYSANALVKARTVTHATGVPALADDSGLEVEALGGAPGVGSARYGGAGLTDRERVERLLEALAEVPDANRAARFRCVLALTAPWGEWVVVDARLEGSLTRAPRGIGGFGYDPIFWVPEVGRTLAELSLAEKSRMSHRARAVAAVRPVLRRWRAERTRRGL